MQGRDTNNGIIRDISYYKLDNNFNYRKRHEEFDYRGNEYS